MDETNRPAARPSAPLVPLLAVACGLAGCARGEDDARPGMAIDEPWSDARAHGLSYAFADAPRRLVAYRWDAGPRVPAAFGSAPATLSYGEAGLSAETVLYLPLNEGTAGRLADRSALAWRVDLQGGAWTEGRYGPGLELGPGARLALESEQRFDGAPVSIELWLEPGAQGGVRGLLSAPGSFRLDRLENGKLRLALDGVRATVTSLAALEDGAWNRVGVVLDGPEIRAVRLVVNDTVASWPRPDGVEPKPWSSLVLAGPAAGAPYVVDDLRVELRGANSAECMERWANAVAPGPHTLALELADGAERTVELWSGVLATPELTSRAQWESGRLEHFVADEDGLCWVPGHWERDRAPSPPLARTTHPVVYVGEHRAFFYGGETKDSHSWPMVNTDDTWIYRIDERTWRRVARSPAPAPRCHQHAAYSPDHGLVLMAGGWRNDALGPKVYDDTWVYHVEEERWEERRSGGLRPRINDSSVVYHAGARLFLTFPGRNVLAYDPEADRWTQLERATVIDENGTPTALPLGGSRIAGYDPRSSLVLLFGLETGTEDGLVYDNPTILYDYDANRFTVRRPDPSPAPRTRGALAWDSKRERFVLFGGVRDQYSRRFEDLWTYDVAESAWTRQEASNAPQRRGGYYGMAYDPELDVFAVLAGRHAVTRFLNEAWRLHLDPAAEAVGAWVFDRAGFPERTTLQADLAVPEGADARLRFAASRDGTTWSDWSSDAAAVVDARARFVKVEVRMTTPPGAAPARVRGLGFGSGEAAGGATSFSVAPFVADAAGAAGGSGAAR